MKYSSGVKSEEKWGLDAIKTRFCWRWRGLSQTSWQRKWLHTVTDLKSDSGKVEFSLSWGKGRDFISISVKDDCWHPACCCILSHLVLLLCPGGFVSFSHFASAEVSPFSFWIFREHGWKKRQETSVGARHRIHRWQSNQEVLPWHFCVQMPSNVS